MNDINNIKRNYSIIDIAKRLGFEIDRNNKSICPFHNDTNPSLSFNIKDNYYHCFSCGASGDNIKLVKEVLHCSFNEAINFITGNNYQYTNKSNTKKEITNDKVKIDYSNIYKTFVDLLNNEEALQYLEKRCITKNQVIEHKIKNIPKDKKEQFLIIKKLLEVYNEKDLINSGIISKSKEYNNLYLFHYKHRLIIPYFNIDGETINSIQGRTIDEDIKPKYLFNKNANDSIYNIDKIGDIKDIIICEGVIDCLSLERLGYNAIALSGATKINILRDYPILEKYNIYSFSDNDKAGKKLIKDIYNFNNYKGTFLISNFSDDKEVKDINELLIKSQIKKFNINNIEYKYLELKNDKICILDYYIFTKNELKYIKKSNDFERTLYLLTEDKKKLTEEEYIKKYGELI